MKLEKDKIILLDDNTKYVVTNNVNYNGKYFLVMGVNDDETTITNEIAILEENKSGDDIYVDKVNDPDLIRTLVPLLKN